MPEARKPGNAAGRIVVGLIAVASIAAAVGTCTRFSADNPYSIRVNALDERSVSAEFDKQAAARIQLKMMAVMSFEDSDLRREGRVEHLKTNLDSVTVVIAFADNLPGLTPARVSVDTSIPPEVLK